LGAKWKELDDEEKKVYLSFSTHILNILSINSSFLFSPMSIRLLVIKRGLRKRKLLTMFVYILSFLQILLIIPFRDRPRSPEVQETTTRRKNKYIVASFLTFYPLFV
jgi:hypothetical protein